MKLISKLEENIVFRFSRGFWRFIVTIAILMVIAGVIVFIWTLFSPSRKKVEKVPYPKISVVEVSDIEAYIKESEMPVQGSAPVESPAGQVPQKKDDRKSVSNEVFRVASLRFYYDSLQKLIPPDKYPYEPQGHWHYPYGSDYFWMKQWIVDDSGINDHILSAWKRINLYDTETGITSPQDAASLLLSYFQVIQPFDESKRKDVLYLLLETTTLNVDSSREMVGAFSRLFPLFRTSTFAPLYNLSQFIARNPNDARNFVNMADSCLRHFPIQYREEALYAMMNGYYNYFSEAVKFQFKLMESFIPMIPSIDTTRLIKYLEIYYYLGNKNNVNQREAIARIDQNYEEESNLAREIFSRKKEQRRELRVKVIYGVGSAIGLILVITTILLLFSIQQYLKKIDTNLAPMSNKNTPEDKAQEAVVPPDE